VRSRSSEAALRTLVLAAMAATAWALLGAGAAAHEAAVQAPASLEMLHRSVVPVDGAPLLSPGALLGADGKPVPAAQLRGRWSLLFFGYTSCPDVCPTTLESLARAARDPALGVANGTTQVIFASVDPAHDTPAVLRTYLAAFDSRFLGFTGSVDALREFAAAAGAGWTSSDGRVDHSTSIFVLNPLGRPIAVLLRAGDPKRIVADFMSVRQAYGEPLAEAH
jgi:protein SCO1/2